MSVNNSQNTKYQRKIDNLLKCDNRLGGFYVFVSDCAISTVYNYLLHVNSFLEYLGNKELWEIDENVMNGYMIKISMNQKGEEATPSYKIAVYSALKKYGNYLVSTGVLKSNPIHLISRPKADDFKKTIEKRDNGFLTKEEIRQLLYSIEKGAGTPRSKKRQLNWKERDLAIVMLLLVTGIKCSDLIQLDVNALDLENKVLFVNNNVVSYDLSNETIEVLKRWLIKRQILLGDQPEESLFISNQRTRMEHGTVYNIIDKYAEVLEGKKVTSEVLRTTYGVQLYGATKDTVFVQEMMGLNSPLSMEKYTKRNLRSTRNAADIMSCLVNANSEKSVALSICNQLDKVDDESCLVLNSNQDLQIYELVAEFNELQSNKAIIIEIDKLQSGELAGAINNLQEQSWVFIVGVRRSCEKNLVMLEELMKYDSISIVIGAGVRTLVCEMPKCKFCIINNDQLTDSFEVKVVKKESLKGIYTERTLEDIQKKYIELKE